MTEPEQPEAAPPPRTARAPRLLDAFRELYAEVTASVAALRGPEPPAPEAVKQRLLNVLTRQAADAADHLGDHERAEFDEAQYVMVAMADEALLQLDWPGREAWARRPLEADSRFGTHVAGERVFDRLDEIAKNRVPVSGDLLSVYLAALSLGFQGRYRVEPSAAEIARFRRDLVRELRRQEPRMVAPVEDLCAEAARGVRDKEPRRGLSSLRDGLLPLLAVICGMLVIGHALWFYRTNDVRDRLDQIEGQRRAALDMLKRVERERQDAREAAAKARAAQKAAPTASPDGGAP
jgi:type VI secretion system protein ImpK